MEHRPRYLSSIAHKFDVMVNDDVFLEHCPISGIRGPVLFVSGFSRKLVTALHFQQNVTSNGGNTLKTLNPWIKPAIAVTPINLAKYKAVASSDEGGALHRS